jgi:hypothetical protein
MKRTKLFKCWLSEKEDAAWRAKANANQMTVSAWVRQRCAGAGRPGKPARDQRLPQVVPACVVFRRRNSRT